MTTRREFLKRCAVTGVIAQCGSAVHALTAQNHASERTVPGTETARFKKAQQNLLRRYGVSARSRYLKLDRPPLTAHVLEAGKGDPLLLLHGGGSTACTFAPLMGLLQKQAHLFAPDRPGCGLTDPFDYRGVPFRQHGVDFVTGIMDSLKLSRAALAGNSMGGYWAMVFALAAPERVSWLVLLGGVAGSPPPPLVRMPPRTPVSMEVTRAMYGVLMAKGERASPEMLEADNAGSHLPGADLAWNSMLEQLNGEGVLTHGLTYALRPELKNLKPPTLFLWGNKDIEGPPSLAQEMAALAPRAHCEVVPDAGHLIWMDQPERCAELMKDFLKK